MGGSKEALKQAWALMPHAESAYGASELVTGTWLNSYPPFTRCFPEPGVTRENNFMPFTSSGDGTWGQFVNARGCFNQKFANRFRETGQLPFEPLRVWCAFEALRRHLQGL